MTGPSPVRSVLVLAVVAVLASGCTGAEDEREPEGAAGSRPPAAHTPAQGASEEPTTAPSRQPLVLAVHATRHPVAIPGTVARDVVAGGVENWRELGHPPAPLRLVDGSDGPASAARARQRVTRDATVLAVLPADAVDPRVRAVRVAG
ncbi:MAG: hypothetical protein ACRDYU_09645, partial [Actinomycetes bacterium]